MPDTPYVVQKLIDLGAPVADAWRFEKRRVCDCFEGQWSEYEPNECGHDGWKITYECDPCYTKQLYMIHDEPE